MMQSVVNKAGFKSSDLKLVSVLKGFYKHETNANRLSFNQRRVCLSCSSHQPALSPRASSPPLCGAAPFPRSACAAPSRAASSARVVAAAAVSGREASGSQQSDAFHMKSPSLWGLAFVSGCNARIHEGLNITAVADRISQYNNTLVHGLFIFPLTNDGRTFWTRGFAFMSANTVIHLLSLALSHTDTHLA